MPSPKLKAHLAADKADEASAIKTYGKHKREAKGSGLTSMLSEIQDDEKDHHKKLSKALSGLRNAKPGQD